MTLCYKLVTMCTKKPHINFYNSTTLHTLCLLSGVWSTWKVVVTWVRRVEFPMWPVWMWAQSVFVVRWTRGRRAREGSSHRTGWRAILGIPLSLAAISSTPPGWKTTFIDRENQWNNFCDKCQLKDLPLHGSVFLLPCLIWNVWDQPTDSSDSHCLTWTLSKSYYWNIRVQLTLVHLVSIQGTFRETQTSVSTSANIFLLLNLYSERIKIAGNKVVLIKYG